MRPIGGGVGAGNRCLTDVLSLRTSVRNQCQRGASAAVGGVANPAITASVLRRSARSHILNNRSWNARRLLIKAMHARTQTGQANRERELLRDFCVIFMCVIEL